MLDGAITKAGEHLSDMLQNKTEVQNIVASKANDTIMTASRQISSLQVPQMT